MTLPWQGTVFALFALALGVTGTYTLVTGIRAGSALYVGFSVMQYGLGLAVAYEAIALWFARVLTISKITNVAFGSHPVGWGIAFCLVMAVVGALTLHFTREKGAWSWQVVSIGLLAFLIGAWVTDLLRWQP